jgi:hypothetical protein
MEFPVLLPEIDRFTTANPRRASSEERRPAQETSGRLAPTPNAVEEPKITTRAAFATVGGKLRAEAGSGVHGDRVSWLAAIPLNATANAQTRDALMNLARFKERN